MFRTQSTIGTLATILALAAWIGARADTQPATGLLNAFVNLNDSASVYRALYDNTPIEPEFKLVPKFAIVGADNKFVFSLGAQMKFTSSFDWGNPVRNPGGMGPSDIHAPVSSDRTLYQMTAGGSNIYASSDVWSDKIFNPKLNLCNKPISIDLSIDVTRCR